jgi:AraC-like DNA-binding protein
VICWFDAWMHEAQRRWRFLGQHRGTYEETAPHYGLPLSALVGAARTTERTLSRLFQQETGMSYPQWPAQARAIHAMILLAQGESVTDTASLCGWSTTSAFIDSFRRAMGQTSGAYCDLAASQTQQKIPAARQNPPAAHLIAGEVHEPSQCSARDRGHDTLSGRIACSRSDGAGNLSGAGWVPPAESLRLRL